MNIERNYYAILGVPPSATHEEIQRSYHRLARRYHPDSREVETPTALFHQVQEAYAVLGNARSRQAYDRQRREFGASGEVGLAWNVVLSRDRLYAGHSEQVLYGLVSVEPTATSQSDRLPLNLCLVIDRSTSMKGGRLEQVKEAARQIADRLHQDDALALVTFHDRAETVIPSQVGINSARARAKITPIRAMGGTEILEGLRMGLAELKKHHGRDVINHLILLTDGRTYGDDEECISEAERAGDQGIGITAMGIGEDWNDELLDTIASRSGGTSAYIASPERVHTLLESKIRGLGATFATGLTLQVRTAERVRLESAFLTSPHLEPLAASGGAMRLGPLQADAMMKILLEIGVGQRPSGEHRLLQLELGADIPARNQLGVVLRRDIRCVFTDDRLHQSEDEVPSAVVKALRQVTLYRMQEQAWAALDEGRVDQATGRLEMVATHLLELGQTRLAHATMLEAGRIAREGGPTPRGRKEIKYGTRSLELGGETHD